jgi:hypothetical protein
VILLQLAETSTTFFTTRPTELEEKYKPISITH